MELLFQFSFWLLFPIRWFVWLYFYLVLELSNFTEKLFIFCLNIYCYFPSFCQRTWTILDLILGNCELFSETCLGICVQKTCQRSLAVSKKTLFRNIFNNYVLILGEIFLKCILPICLIFPIILTGLLYYIYGYLILIILKGW